MSTWFACKNKKMRVENNYQKCTFHGLWGEPELNEEDLLLFQFKTVQKMQKKDMTSLLFGKFFVLQI